MKVLIACEESQTVCKAFRKRGHEAFSCDIQDCSGGHPEWHIKGNVLNLINPTPLIGNNEFGIVFETVDGLIHYVDKWDLIVAHPPCTYLSAAGASRLYHPKGILDVERYKKGLDAQDFFIKIWHADCEKICIENPVQLKIFFEIPHFSQEIQPCEYGHPYSKKNEALVEGFAQTQTDKNNQRKCSELG